MITFTDPDLSELSPDDARIVRHVWQAACIAIAAADASTREAVARQIAAGARMTHGIILPDRTIVVRVGDVEVLRTTPKTLAIQLMAREKPGMN